MRKRMIIAALLGFLLSAGMAGAEEGSQTPSPTQTVALPEAFKGLSIGVKGYFVYKTGDGADEAGSGLARDSFRTTRAYLDVKKKLTDDLLVRWTSDYESQAAKGDANIFMKYLYMEYALPLNAALTLGMAPAPYIGFYEEKWPFRVVDKVPQERFKALDSSIDMGVTLGGRIKVADTEYGSYQAGVFNNQHYRVNDDNRNKAVEGRLTVRPLAFTGMEALKGLELTYFGIRGEDGAEKDKDTANYGDHKNDTLAAGYSFAGLNLGYEYYTTTRYGGTKDMLKIKNESTDGKTANAGDNKLFFDEAKGQSAFAVYRLPAVGAPAVNKVRLFGEYAVLQDIRVGKATNPKDGEINSTLMGLSYDIYKDKTIVVLSRNNVDYKNMGTAAGDEIYQVSVQIAY